MQIQTPTVLLFIIFILLIIFVNYIIFSMLRNKKGNSEFDIMRKSANAIRKPFEQEDKQFDELSRLVNELNIDKEDEKI